MMIHDYPKEFVERTLKLLDECFDDVKSKDLEVTFLLNCLLGLIVATYEQLDLCQGDFFEKRLAETDILQFVPTKIAKVDFKEFNKRLKDEINKKSLIGQLPETISIESEIVIQGFKMAKNLTLKEFIKNIRNGIAHQNLMATSQSENWAGVRIWNHNNHGIKDFEVEFSIAQLKKFAHFIGKSFLAHLPDKGFP